MRPSGQEERAKGVGMAVLISNDDELDTLLEPAEIEDICATVLAAEGVAREVEVSVSFVSDEEMHGLNREWRGIDRVTDVLSFECDAPDDEAFPQGRPWSWATSSSRLAR